MNLLINFLRIGLDDIYQIIASLIFSYEYLYHSLINYHFYYIIIIYSICFVPFEMKPINSIAKKNIIYSTEAKNCTRIRIPSAIVATISRPASWTQRAPWTKQILPSPIIYFFVCSGGCSIIHWCRQNIAFNTSDTHDTSSTILMMVIIMKIVSIFAGAHGRVCVCVYRSQKNKWENCCDCIC